jgi:hypothetical protein
MCEGMYLSIFQSVERDKESERERDGGGGGRQNENGPHVFEGSVYSWYFLGAPEVIC